VRLSPPPFSTPSLHQTEPRSCLPPTHLPDKGNDFTYANSLFTAGYIVGQLPSALILSSNRVPPRVWLPGCVFAWGVLTLGLACESVPGPCGTAAGGPNEG
jgi:ACS family pantothenate transporter-like MFS transporter